MRHPLRRVAPTVLAVGTALALTACGATVGSGEPASSDSGAGVPELHNALPQQVKDSGVLKFAGDSHPPYRTVGTDGTTVTGIDKDFQDALGKLLGVRTETQIVTNLSAALQGMLSGRYDAFNGPVKATAEREQQFDTITWMTTRTSYVVPSNSTAGIKTVDDLCGKRVALVKASIVEDQLAKLSQYCTGKGKPAATALPLDDTNGTLLATQAGRADAAGMTQAAAIDVTSQQKGSYSYVTQTEAQGATADDLALLVPKSSGMGQVMLKAFQQLFDNGEYRRIMQQWGLTDVMVAAPLLDVATSK
ncbi:transporter substrate-binding domain-containing protein [Amycolatopsis sp. K13G38]|uniref:Transporter substrate-binding domain-containing protein n=1 Tax=Amycolatopsis acididurans TaxID=2724524 RepID=A0ABX1IV34_9PSEU|nr:transporter substrate-binding domain-containing protein [Amycolatopsis acididurans]NKQ51349.1 transporter substrate-binding domain-containing protein [Amycolatopsis acididurans]